MYDQIIIKNLKKKEWISEKIFTWIFI